MPGRPLEITTCRLQDKIDLIVGRERFDRCFRNRDVCRSDQSMVVPGNCKHDSSIGCVGNHDRCITRKKRSIKDQMDPLTRRDQIGCRRISHASDTITKCARRIDHDFRVDVKLMGAFPIARDDSTNKPIIIAA